MTPKFADSIAWQQAELLMQPVFIRVIDNLRKQLEQSSWKGVYRDAPVWAADVPIETQTRVAQLQQQLVNAPPEQAAAIKQTLAHLPRPHPGYELCLTQPDRQINIDLWDLCYRICFDRYSPADQTVAIDTTLIDETGDVDWQRLDEKAKRIIEAIFAELPNSLG